MMINLKKLTMTMKKMMIMAMYLMIRNASSSEYILTYIKAFIEIGNLIEFNINVY